MRSKTARSEVVLKDQRRSLYQDVTALFPHVPPQPGKRPGRDCQWGDLAGLLSRPQVKTPLRIVRSLETYSVRRQLDRTTSRETCDWIRVTALPRRQAPTGRVVAWGRQRMGY